MVAQKLLLILALYVFIFVSKSYADDIPDESGRRRRRASLEPSIAPALSQPSFAGTSLRPSAQRSIQPSTQSIRSPTSPVKDDKSLKPSAPRSTQPNTQSHRPPTTSPIADDRRAKVPSPYPTFVTDVGGDKEDRRGEEGGRRGGNDDERESDDKQRGDDIEERDDEGGTSNDISSNSNSGNTEFIVVSLSLAAVFIFIVVIRNLSCFDAKKNSCVVRPDFTGSFETHQLQAVSPVSATRPKPSAPPSPDNKWQWDHMLHGNNSPAIKTPRATILGPETNSSLYVTTRAAYPLATVVGNYEQSSDESLSSV